MGKNKIALSRRLKLALVSIVLLSVLVATITALRFSLIERPYTQENGQQSAESHFSVRWMGFFPSYSSQYPEYYICINNLKSAILAMDIALQIKNQEDAGYYFKGDKYEEPPVNWTISPLEIGFVDVDQTKTFTYPVYRSKPTNISQGRLTETINFVIGAYYDSAYLNLYSQDNFTVTFNFIDRTSSAWTLLSHDNFDGGTTQGWSGVGGGVVSFGVSDTYYRSFPYSLRLYARMNQWASYSKVFNVGFEEAFLIFSMKSRIYQLTDVEIRFDGTTYFKPDVTPSADIWYQFAVPLPLGETSVAIGVGYSESSVNVYLDDVFVIAK